MSKTEVIKLTSGASSLIHCQNRINEAHVVLNTSATNSDPNLLQVAWMPTGEVCLWHPPRKRNLLRRKVCDGTCVHRLGLKTQKWVPHDLMLYKLTSPWLKTLASFGAERGGWNGWNPFVNYWDFTQIWRTNIPTTDLHRFTIYHHIMIVVWKMFDFPYFGNNHPNWLSSFSEGYVYHQPDIQYRCSLALASVPALTCPYAHNMYNERLPWSQFVVLTFTHIGN